MQWAVFEFRRQRRAVWLYDLPKLIYCAERVYEMELKQFGFAGKIVVVGVQINHRTLCLRVALGKNSDENTRPLTVRLKPWKTKTTIWLIGAQRYCFAKRADRRRTSAACFRLGRDTRLGGGV